VSILITRLPFKLYERQAWLSRCFDGFVSLQGFLSNYRKGKHVILALWCARNEKIFEAKVRTPEEIFEKIQLISWKWLLSKKANSPCLFYEWCVFSFD
jgi:hypothetical protein